MGHPTKNCTILVVEDEMLVRADAVGVFESDGYRVFDAENAAEALKLIDGRAMLWALFSDIDMPGAVDGLALAHEVRRRYPATHIILTSGKPLPNGRDMPTGCQFVSKPYRIDDISRMFDQLHADGCTPLAA